MFFKKIKKYATVFLLTFIIIPNQVLAYSNYLIPGGENIGIEVNSKGIIIVGTYEVNGTKPANNAGLKQGDIITQVDDKDVKNIDEMINIINLSKSLNLKITFKRDNEILNTTLSIYKDGDILKTGLYVKDSITGIGTLSFIDPNTKIYGALGHEIIEKTTGKILEVQNGTIFESTVIDIERSENGDPGSKNATLNSSNTNGTIIENTESGIFGTFTSNLPSKKLYKVAQYNEIKLGEAKILTVVEGNDLGEYSINILEVNNENTSKTKNILFEITDQNLLNKTGGIVQGMSGSTIIQGNYIIGAVTHVIVDNPKRGYGILITNMLEEAEN
ncbi:MAG: SpoIVB peptidase [Bacilli bacterium]